jgi:GNAT superfamily N-acetyltransferase
LTILGTTDTMNLFGAARHHSAQVRLMSQRNGHVGLTYFKRFRMEIDLLGRALTQPLLPLGYGLVRWDDALLDLHAKTKYQCFHGEIDANVFPCLSDLAGCYRLMNEIREKEGFLPAATWLCVYRSSRRSVPEYVGTVQGVRDSSGVGAIQNLGIVPDHRGKGLGSILMIRALAGFQQAQVRRAFLEVTSQNFGAIRLYQRLGFRLTKTVYKAVEVAYA